MPELPEVEVTRRGVIPYLVNEKISNILVRNGKLRYPVPEDMARLTGEKIIAVGRRAKYLLVETTHDLLLIHLGMSGSLRIMDKGSNAEKHDHIIIEFNQYALYYNDPRRFGSFQLFAQGETPPCLLTLAPEPLSADFHSQYLYALMQKSSRPVKVIIMDQKQVVGVGNIYASEALFMAGIHPKRSGCSLSEAECQKLVAAIKTVLEKSIEAGGTTLKDFKNPDGKPGYFVQKLSVYDRKGEPCKICGQPVSREIIAQRATFWCAHCQKFD